MVSHQAVSPAGASDAGRTASLARMTAAHGLWPKGAATGCGSMPGTDPGEALEVVAGELPDLPHLPESPNRGPGAELTGRAAALLVDLPLEHRSTGWGAAGAVGLDLRRARAYLAHDLDLLEERFSGYEGPLKLQVCGPVTLAATVELRSGEKALADHGAMRDLARSLAEGAVAHVADVRRRVPGAEVLLQWDEPGLPAVLDGRVPTASGWGRLRALQPADAEAVLGAAFAAATGAGAAAGAHCCAPEAPVALLARSGARFLSLDVTLAQPVEALGDALEAGVALIAGIVPTDGSAGSGGTVGPRPYVGADASALESDRAAGGVVGGRGGEPDLRAGGHLSGCRAGRIDGRPVGRSAARRGSRGRRWALTSRPTSRLTRGPGTRSWWRRSAATASSTTSGSPRRSATPSTTRWSRSSAPWRPRTRLW